MSPQIDARRAGRGRSAQSFISRIGDAALILVAGVFLGIVMGECVLGMSGHFGPGYQSVQWEVADGIAR